jgi:hypothetical protein
LRRARIRVGVTPRAAGAALCTSLLLESLHGTNPKQHSLLSALSPVFPSRWFAHADPAHFLSAQSFFVPQHCEWR